MAVQFYNGILDKLIAPQIGTFNAVEIPDLNKAFDQEDYWLANLFLNSLFGPNYGEQGY